MYSRRTNTIEEKETPGRYYRRETERRRKEAEATHLASLHLASALQHTQVLQDRGSKDPFVVCKVYKCIFSYNIHPEARARKFITNIMRSNSGAFRCAVDPVNPRSLHRTFFLTCFKRIPCSDTNRVCISDLETLAKKQQNIAGFLNLALSRKVGAANRVSARLPSSRSYRWRLFVESNLSAVCEQFCVFLYVIRSFFHPPTLTPLSSALFTKCDRR